MAGEQGGCRAEEKKINLVNFGDACVPIVALGRHVGDEAHAAKDLEACGEQRYHDDPPDDVGPG